MSSWVFACIVHSSNFLAYLYSRCSCNYSHSYNGRYARGDFWYLLAFVFSEIMTHHSQPCRNLWWTKYSVKLWDYTYTKIMLFHMFFSTGNFPIPCRPEPWKSWNYISWHISDKFPTAVFSFNWFAQCLSSVYCQIITWDQLLMSFLF